MTSSSKPFLDYYKGDHGQIIRYTDVNIKIESHIVSNDRVTNIIVMKIQKLWNKIVDKEEIDINLTDFT